MLAAPPAGGRLRGGGSQLRTRYSIATCRRMRSSLAAVDAATWTRWRRPRPRELVARIQNLEERKSAGDGASHRIDGLSRFADVGKGLDSTCSLPPPSTDSSPSRRRPGLGRSRSEWIDGLPVGRFAEVRKRIGLDVLAAPPAGGRLAVKDSIFDCEGREISRSGNSFAARETVEATRMGSRRDFEKELVDNRMFDH